MKEVKEFRKSYIFVSALYVVLGVVLLVWPKTSVQMICYALGLTMVVLGITYGLIYFTKNNLNSFLQMDLVIGIICLAFGVFVLLNPTFLASVLPFAMGIILLLGAVVKLQSSLNMRRLGFRKWYVVLLFAVLIVALAIVLLCNLFSEERYMILYIGGCLVLDGMTNLGSLISILVKVRKLEKIQRENPDVNLQDLLEQHRKSSAVRTPRTKRKAVRAKEKAVYAEGEVVQVKDAVVPYESASKSREQE